MGGDGIPLLFLKHSATALVDPIFTAYSHFVCPNPIFLLNGAVTTSNLYPSQVTVLQISDKLLTHFTSECVVYQKF